MQLFKKVQKIIENSGILANSRVRTKEFDHSSITLMYGEHGTSIRLSAEKKFGKIGGKETGYRYRCVSTVRRGDSVFVEDAPSILRMFRNFCSRTDEIDSFHENCKKILPKQQMNINKGSHSVEFDLSENVVLSVWMSLHVSSSLYSCDTSLDLTPIGSGERRMQLSYLEGEDLNALITESLKICERRMSSMKNLLASNCVEIRRDEVKLGKQEIFDIVLKQAKIILAPGVMTIKKLDRSEMVRKELNRYYDNFNAIETFEEALAKHGVYFVKDGPDFIGGENNEFVKELIEIHDKHNRDFLLINLSEFAACHGLYYSGI